LNKIEGSPKAAREEMITSITTSKGTITFSSEDLLPICAAQDNTLYLTVTCLQKHVRLALVDNSSTVNTCPYKMAERLGVKEKQLSALSTHPRAYSSSKRLILGTIHLPMNVGPIERNIEL